MQGEFFINVKMPRPPTAAMWTVIAVKKGLRDDVQLSNSFNVRGQNSTLLPGKKSAKSSRKLPPSTPVKSSAGPGAGASSAHGGSMPPSDAALIAECKVCGVDDEEENVLCDGCDGVFHLACADIQTIPAGQWYCPSCCSDTAASSKFKLVAKKGKRKHQSSRFGISAVPQPVPPRAGEQSAKRQKKQMATAEPEPVKSGAPLQTAHPEDEHALGVDTPNLASAAAVAPVSASAASGSASASAAESLVAPAAKALEDCFLCMDNPGTVFTNCGHSVGCSSCNVAPKRCPTCRTNVHFTHCIEESLEGGCLPKCWMCPNPVNVILRPCNCLIICTGCLDAKQIKCCPRHGGETFGRVELFTN